MADLVWLEVLKESFSSTDADYEGLYELIEASIVRGGLIFLRLSTTLRRDMGPQWLKVFLLA